MSNGLRVGEPLLNRDWTTNYTEGYEGLGESGEGRQVTAWLRDLRKGTGSVNLTGLQDPSL